MRKMQSVHVAWHLAYRPLAISPHPRYDARYATSCIKQYQAKRRLAWMFKA